MEELLQRPRKHSGEAFSETCKSDYELKSLFKVRPGVDATVAMETEKYRREKEDDGFNTYEFRIRKEQLSEMEGMEEKEWTDSQKVKNGEKKVKSEKEKSQKLGKQWNIKEGVVKAEDLSLDQYPVEHEAGRMIQETSTSKEERLQEETTTSADSTDQRPNVRRSVVIEAPSPNTYKNEGEGRQSQFLVKLRKISESPVIQTSHVYCPKITSSSRRRPLNTHQQL